MKILLLLCLFLFSSVAFDVQRMEVLKGLRIVPPITDDDDDSNSANSPSICDAGDVDKDGIKDLLVGFASINTVYLLFGTTNSDLSSRYPDGVLNLTSAVSRGFALQFLGAPVSQLGYTVSSAGDVNNDGFADILLGAPGEGACYLVFGAAKEHMRVRYDSLFNFATGDFQDGIKFSSSNTVSKFGSALSHAGDFNGDGYQDFLIGAFAENTVYLVYGDTFLALQSRFGRDYTFGGAGQPFQTSMGMHWVGGSLSSVLGWSLSSAGDLNKDGFTDIIMGSFADSLCFIIFGAPVTALTSAWGSDFPLPLDTQTLNSSQVIQLVNQDEYSYFGWAVTACGDVNGDGYDDVAIGAWANARIFIFYGSANINTTNESVFYFQANNFPAERGLTVANSDPNSAFGLAIASIGDLDKDGYSDIIIGSHAEKTAYVLYGRASPTLTFNVSKSESENIPGKNSKRSFDVLLDSVISSSLGASVSSAGDFNNDTYADLLIKDTITGDTFLLFTSMNCSSSCLRCLESPSVCTMCVPTMPYLYRSQCYSSCPSGTFKSPINQCEPCTVDTCGLSATNIVPKGELIGIIIGGVVAFLFILAGSIIILKRRKFNLKKTKKTKEHRGNHYINQPQTVRSTDLESPTSKSKGRFLSNPIESESVNPSRADLTPHPLIPASNAPSANISLRDISISPLKESKSPGKKKRD